MNENAQKIEAFIVSELTDEVEAGSLPHDRDLLAADLIDSVGITELVGFLESDFGIAVGDEDLTPENFSSVDSIVAFVARKGG